ncbi:MAG: glycosyltransferase family 9 protein [Elusimicrobia bacterium]|nr:glycosyltransferase family 9 protein [Elusimicrobiota bacterium]
MKKSKILIIVFKGIGDVILTTPLIKALKTANPENEIFFLTKKFAAPILKNNPNIKEILIREEKTLIKILTSKFDISVDFMLSSSSGAYCLFSKAKERIAFYRPWNGIFYNRRVKKSFDGYNALERMEILKPLGLKPNDYYDIKPQIFLTEEEKKEAENIAASLGANIGKIVTFDITSPRSYRQPSADFFIAMADKLSEIGYSCIFPPGPGEEEYVKKAVSKSGNKHFIAEKLSLRQLASIISISSLHVGTSSAPMHMAVAFDKPTFTVYSPYTSPSSWGPGGERHAFFQKDLNSIKMEEIMLSFEKFLRKIGI